MKLIIEDITLKDAQKVTLLLDKGKEKLRKYANRKKEQLSSDEGIEEEIKK